MVFCVGGQFEMKLINFRNNKTVTEKFAVSNPDLASKTVATSSRSDHTANKQS